MAEVAKICAREFGFDKAIYAVTREEWARADRKQSVSRTLSRSRNSCTRPFWPTNPAEGKGRGAACVRERRRAHRGRRQGRLYPHARWLRHVEAGGEIRQGDRRAQHRAQLEHGDRAGEDGRRHQVTSSSLARIEPAARNAVSVRYQLPVLAIDAQGSAFSSAGPFCNSSIEMPSGDLMKAMLPSRGGRLMVTPPSIRRWQVS